VTVLLAAAVVPVGEAVIITVPGDEPTIQAAIDAALDGDEIVVAPGTYFETIDFIGKAVWLHSSDGAEVTTIDAQQNGSVVTCTSSEGPDTVLEGFPVTGGTGTLVAGTRRGGGLYNVNSSPTVTGCYFYENGFTSFGGGIFNLNSDPVVTDCTFAANLVARGGGMSNHESNPTVTHCTFEGNSSVTSGEAGSGMYNFESNPIISDCAFTGNLARDGSGAGMANRDSDPLLLRCLFAGNAAGFVTASGGGMSNANSDPMLIDCVFRDNVCGLGGGLSAGAPTGQSSDPVLINCLFVGNSAESGGAVFISHGGPSSINCTFFGNQAEIAGGGFFDHPNLGPSFVTMTNCIFWNNSVGGSTDEAAQIAGTTPTIDYSCVQGWTGALGGIGNIGADPLFVDPDNSDYRLSAGSPCIDAGDNTAVPEEIISDLDGNPRFLEIPETPDTGNGDIPIVDMGAYESLGRGCLAITSQEVVCHADATMFVNIEGINGCTGGTIQVTFTGSGGAVGEELCFTALVNDGGFCCSTEICVTVPHCPDCNNNGFLDLTDIANGTSQDCNGNGVPDECDIADETSSDCNDNGVPDECDPTLDCNGNGVPDACDVADGTSADVNGNDVPDECECLADINGDGSVDITDFLQLLAVWGPCEPGCFGDVDFDGNVGITDFLTLLGGELLAPDVRRRTARRLAGRGRQRGRRLLPVVELIVVRGGPGPFRERRLVDFKPQFGGLGGVRKQAQFLHFQHGGPDVLARLPVVQEVGARAEGLEPLAARIVLQGDIVTLRAVHGRRHPVGVGLLELHEVAVEILLAPPSNGAGDVPLETYGQKWDRGLAQGVHPCWKTAPRLPACPSASTPAAS
jgi:hypothetical protein